MWRKDVARAALAGRIRRNRLVAAAVIGMALLACFFWFRAGRVHHHSLRMTAGDPLSQRHRMAQILCEESRAHGLEFELIPTSGSQEALAKIAAGDVDVGLVLGDLEFSAQHIREVAVLWSEPLHLFVKPELLADGVAGLRGKTLSLSVQGSSTHKVAERMLAWVGMQAGRDYVEQDLNYQALREAAPGELPDGIFAMTALPWEGLGELLVQKHGYRLMELPFAEALALRDPSLHDMLIPPYTYRVDPPVPAKAIHTVAERLLVVANDAVPEAAVFKLMRVLFQSDFARRAELPTLDATDVDRAREFPLHPGTVRYLHRNEPLLSGEMIDKLENLRSFLVSAVLAVFLFWRWRKKRNMIGFEKYIDAVTEVEVEGLTLDRNETLDPHALSRLRRRLSELKAEALERHAEGALAGEEQMAGFLTHVSDVRNYLDSLSLRGRGSPPDVPPAEAVGGGSLDHDTVE